MTKSADTMEFKRQIEEQTVEFLAAFKRRDAQSLVKLYTDDVIALYPGSPPSQGRAALAKGYQALFDAGVKMSGITTQHYECDGTVGYALQIAHTSQGDVAALLTFRRGADGIWLASGEAVPGAPTT
jgi:ketosteroid isomerase-like protein